MIGSWSKQGFIIALLLCSGVGFGASKADLPETATAVSRTLRHNAGPGAATASQVMREGFEAAWPAQGWLLEDAGQGDGGEYLWGPRSCHPHSGYFAAWATGGGVQGRLLDCNNTYPDNARTWAIYGPFDLSTATGASLSFHLWGRSEGGAGCPADFLFVGSSTDESEYLGSSFCGRWLEGDAGNDYSVQTLDLGHRLGQRQVWIGFAFVSDNEVSYGGFTVDDVDLRATFAADITPTPSTTASPTVTATPTVPFRVWVPFVLQSAAPAVTATPAATRSLSPTARLRIITTPTATPTPDVTATPTETPGGPDYFLGQTDQELPVEITILPDRSAVTMWKITYTATCSGSVYLNERTVKGRSPITQRRFAIDVPTGLSDTPDHFAGEFDETFTSAHGTYFAWIIRQSPIPQIVCSVTGTWTASTRP